MRSRILKSVSIVIATLAFLGFVLNRLVRVGHTPIRSIGIVEQLLFGGPIEEVLAPPWSEDYKRWDSASKASAAVAELLQQYGTKELAISDDLSEQRAQAEDLSNWAFESASTISRSYLAETNAELPEAYFNYFVPAMDAWRHGFADKNAAEVKEGISAYNAFLEWMQSRESSDFRPMR